MHTSHRLVRWMNARWRVLAGIFVPRADAFLGGEAQPAQRLLAAVVLVAAAALLRVAFLGPLGSRIPYVTLFPAVMLAAVYGGLAGGLLATALSAAIAVLWFQGGRLDEGTQLALVIFLATCTLMSLVGGALLRVRDRLRWSEERFRIAAEASNDVVYEWDLKDRVAWFGGVDALLGYAPGEFPRTLAGFIAAVYPEDIARVNAAIEAHLEGRAKYLVEYRMLRKDGAVRWWSARGVAARRPDGTPYRWVGTITDITERRKAEEARRESEDRFEYFFENSVIGKSMTDAAGGLRVNRSFAAMLGYTQAELQGKAWASVSHPDDAEATKAEVQALLDGARSTARFTKRYLRRDGAVLWADVSTALRRDAAEKPLYFMTTVLDITERKRADDALRESESRFRQLAESMPQLVWTCEPDGPCDYLNRGWLEYTGVPETPQLGFGWLEQLHPDDRAQAVATWEAAVASGGDFQTEFRIRRHDGEYRWFDTRAVRLRDAGGRTVKWFGTNTDITERRVSEEALRTSQERLLLSQRAAGLGNFSWDIQRNVNEWSDEIMELYGLPPGAFGGRYESWRERVFPDDIAEADAAIERSLVDGEFQHDFRIVRPDGAIRWLQSRAKVFFSPDGKPLRMVGVNMDITERKQAEEEIRRLNAELEERVIARTAQLEVANKELEAFSYSVSHDLRAPLRAVDGFSRILLEDHAPQLDAEGKRLLGVVRSSTRQMGQLIDDLLSFSRVGRQALAKTVVDMRALAEDAFRGLVAPDERVSFKVGDLPCAEADRALVRQVFANLIGNALKFTGPKRERVITVEGRIEESRVVYGVKDNGVGFDMAYANKLFGVFQRLHSSAEFEGTGIGLALVKRIVSRHGGEVWAEGKVGEGATFSFSLPRSGGSS